jgi:hypothetical protein
MAVPIQLVQAEWKRFNCHYTQCKDGDLPIRRGKVMPDDFAYAGLVEDIPTISADFSRNVNGTSQ